MVQPVLTLMVLLLVLLLAFIPSLVSAAINLTRIDIVNAPSPLWEERIRADIDRSNRFLCRAFTQLPDRVRVFRRDRAAEYDLSLGMIFLGQNYLPVHLYHEYGHKILDHYLQRHSSILGYYRLRERMGSQRLLEDSLQQLERELGEDQRFLNHLRRQHYFKLAGNLSRWIRNHTDLLYEGSSVLHLESKLAGVFEGFGYDQQRYLYRMMTPYHELFADTLAVLMTGRWESILMAGDRIKSPNSSGERRLGFYRSDPRTPAAEILRYRAFNPLFSIQHYPLAGAELISDYAKFAPVRSYIRKLADQHFEGREALMLRLLAEAIQQQLDQRLSDNSKTKLDIEEMNRGLIASLQSRLSSYQKKTENHCQPVAAISLVQ